MCLHLQQHHAGKETQQDETMQTGQGILHAHISLTKKRKMAFNRMILNRKNAISKLHTLALKGAFLTAPKRTLCAS